MLLFHGTVGEINSIFEKGLISTEKDLPEDIRARHWSSYITQQPRGIFFSSSPVGSKGGDPISFAAGWPYQRFRTEPGHIVVVDLPKDRSDYIQAVFPSSDVDFYYEMIKWRSDFLDKGAGWGSEERSISRWQILYWMRKFFIKEGVLGDANKIMQKFYVKERKIDDAAIIPDNMTPELWESFIKEFENNYNYSKPGQYHKQLAKLLNKFNVSFPEYGKFWFRGHCEFCSICVDGLCQFELGITGFDEYLKSHIGLENGYSFWPAYYKGRTPKKFPLWLKIADLHFRSFPDKEIEEFFSQYEHKKKGYPKTIQLAGDLDITTLQKTILSGLKGNRNKLQEVMKRFTFDKATKILVLKDYYHPDFDDFIISATLQEDKDTLKEYYLRESKGLLWQWKDWYRHFPASECDLPAVWQPGYGKEFNLEDIRNHDMHVITKEIPPDYILGAIKITDGRRFLPGIKPSKKQGITMESNIWKMVHFMRDEFSGKPILIEPSKKTKI